MDRLTPELRRIEKEIDYHFYTNPLAQLPRGTAMWHLIGETEYLLHPSKGGVLNSQQMAARTDKALNDIRHPWAWLYGVCPPGDKIPDKLSRDHLGQAAELLQLGGNYDIFERVFTYASHGIIGLAAEGNDLITTHSLDLDTRYEAYNRLIKVSAFEPTFNLPDKKFFEELRSAVRPRSDGFSLRFNPRLVLGATRMIAPLLARKFTLPEDWEFSRYSLKEFKDVTTAITAMVVVHSMAQNELIAAQMSEEAFSTFALTFEINELVSRLHRYSGVQERQLHAIIEDLTYGSGKVKRLDPMIQPILRLGSKLLIIPSLWTGSSTERNHTVLLNRLPNERTIYSRLVEEKESAMRKRIKEKVALNVCRVAHGNIPGRPDLPDIDLAIISDSEKVCLLLELKWFIEPADPRELIEKREDIQKGIQQIKNLLKPTTTNTTAFQKKLNVTGDFHIAGAVISANWIGHADVQDPVVPIILERHLIAKLTSTPRLLDVTDWLRTRRYLPIPGRDYEKVETPAQVGAWRVNWYGLKPLVEGDFFPL